MFSFFPQLLKVFDQEIVPVFELMFKAKPTEYIIGMRLMKCSILVMNNLGIGINLLNYILLETDGIVAKGKEGSISMNLTWRCLIGFECLTIALSNPNLVRVFSQCALQVGKTVLVQVFESLINATDHLDLSGE